MMREYKKNTLSKTITTFIMMTLILEIIFSNITRAEAITNETLILEEKIDVAAQVVSEMGVGWNLGNTLDAYSIETYDINQKKLYQEDYQIMATYSTQSYSGWDASPVPYFSSSSSKGELSWRLSSLNSATNQACGRFAFQIINHSVEDSGVETLDFTVTKAEFRTMDGTVIVLTDMLGDYSKVIKDDVTTYVVSDLKQISKLSTTADVIGGTLTIAVEINEYPMPISMSSMTKEVYYETLWGNPVTTKAMIDEVKKEGFGAVRIPVTYYNHIDEQGNIDSAWLERVGEVVGYVLDNDMYCIITVHHDTGSKGWIKADLDTFEKTSEQFEYLWQQIGQYFQDYDQKLLFEGYNELLNSANQWTLAGEDSYYVANQLNQVFVDTVRNIGGNNTQRCLIVNTYAASSEQEVMKFFQIPEDTIENHLIVGVHYYGSSENGINEVINRMNTYFINKGIPAIIGECGTTWKMDEANRVNCANNLVSTAKDYNITIFWWDDGNYKNEVGAKCCYSIFDKCALTWYYPSIAEALVTGAEKNEIIDSE
jgi:aryl-phospho-beta-D-glucosidase BglC (GH1 family)